MASEKKSSPVNRRQFVRTNVPLAELVSSAVILLLLAVIGVAIAIKGRHFDPNLFTVRADSLKDTAKPVVGASDTAPAMSQAKPAEASSAAEKPDVAATSLEEAGGGDNSGGSPPPAVKGEAMEVVIPGIKPMSDTEFYNADTLYEKIDGRSPAYQSFNVQALRCRTFNVVAAAGSFVDVYEYRFDSPVDAFGMFALERDPKGGPLDFATDGYSGEMGYFFRQGAVYVQVIASDQKPETLAMTKAIALNRAKELPVDDSGLAGRRKLPAAGMIADSVEFLPEDALGQSDLKDVYQAKYNFEGTQLPFFIMVTTPADAAKAWQSFKDFCGKFGTAENLPDENGGKIFSAQVFGKWKVVYQRDGEIGGVAGAADEAKAEAFVKKYLRSEIK